jgi:hypothetical protein
VVSHQSSTSCRSITSINESMIGTSSISHGDVM